MSNSKNGLVTSSGYLKYYVADWLIDDVSNSKSALAPAPAYLIILCYCLIVGCVQQQDWLGASI